MLGAYPESTERAGGAVKDWRFPRFGHRLDLEG
jgi:hypothetical protein